jgi:outer membrane protein
LRSAQVKTALQFQQPLGTLFRGAMLAGALCVATGIVFAQGASSQGGGQGEKKEAASSASGKIAVLAVRGAIATTAEGKQAEAELQSQSAPKQAELDGIKKQISDIQQRLQAGQGKLSQEEGLRLTRQADSLQRQGQRKQQDYSDELQAAEAEILDRIGRKMSDVLNRYCREKGYSVVLDSSAQGTPVIFAAPGVDITEEIVRLYDQQYPVKAQAPAKQPAKQ